MKPGDTPEPESTNRSTDITKNTGRGTVVQAPADDSTSVYTLPEAVKPGAQGYFPLLLRWDTRKYDVLRNEEHPGGFFCWHPFLSRMGFVYFDTFKEAVEFLYARDYSYEDYTEDTSKVTGMNLDQIFNDLYGKQ